MNSQQTGVMNMNILSELHGVERCTECVYHDRNCIIKEELECCMACKLLKTEKNCLFTRTVRHTSIRYGFTWEEMNGKSLIPSEHMDKINTNYSNEGFNASYPDPDINTKENPYFINDPSISTNTIITATPVSENDNFRFILENYNHRGKRKGHLNPGARVEANEVRKKGACWMCRQTKSLVSDKKNIKCTSTYLF